ncbi:DUF3509 domain-containing protein [Pseudomonas sp. MAFF212428]|uniref:DUF3509 domain-containing protein n=1 Tax=Pseudomonas brassicae TaxID=2708063 RepID=A0A6B3NS85_9PSED|nr:DUF3509 domain-containing protein [Pseudomonas brassicae]NER60540.1 DUF3509 domain-containing protein [Pseudomonas brassicae]NER64776.1 DUF3509 domain-containing protein [Pseudomonas brassicae]
MNTISMLLSEALTPYQVTLTSRHASTDCDLLLTDPAGDTVLRRSVKASQLHDQRLLVDLVDGLQRDLGIHEGRLQPCVIAALQHARQSRTQILAQ